MPVTLSLRIPQQSIDWAADPRTGKPAGNLVIEERTIPITGALMIGRSPECQLQFEIPAMSRKHCEVCANDAGAKIHDRMSMNGTFVNSQQMAPESERELRVGDVITVAGVRIEIIEESLGETSLTQSGLDGKTTVA